MNNYKKRLNKSKIQNLKLNDKPLTLGMGSILQEYPQHQGSELESAKGNVSCNTTTEVPFGH